MAKLRVFLAWSGPRSNAVANALRKWLKRVIQTLDPWMSEIDINKGKRWSGELSAQLQDVKAGIVCLTPENLREPWINFEAGALSKLADSHVCTYLHGLDAAEISGPLADFQHTKATKEDTRQLIRTLNKLLAEDALEEGGLDESFNMWWDKLEKELSEIKVPAVKEQDKREPEDMFKEIVNTLRSFSQSHANILAALEETTTQKNAFSSLVTQRAIKSILTADIRDIATPLKMDKKSLWNITSKERGGLRTYEAKIDKQDPTPPKE